MSSLLPIVEHADADEPKRSDVVTWLAAVFPEVDFPKDEQYILRLQDGVLLCQLAHKIKPDTLTLSPSEITSENQIANISSFISFCYAVNLHERLVFSIDDLTDTDTSSLAGREAKITSTLVALGVISNEIGYLQIKFELNDTIKQPIALKPALLQPAIDSNSGKKLSIRRIGKEKSVRFSLSTKKNEADAGLQLEGSESMTPEQLEQFYKITGGSFGKLREDSKPTEKLSVPVLTTNGIDAKRLSRIPPLHDRHLSFNFSSRQCNTLQINISRLALPCTGEDITLNLTKMPAFLNGDYLKIDDEVMQVKGMMGEVLMVQRGVEGSVAAKHEEGATVTQLMWDEGGVATTEQSYDVLRTRAIDEHFEDLDAMDFLDLLESTEGHTFVYFISHKFDKTKNLDRKGNHNDDRLLAYLINRLEVVVTNQYSILYFHSAEPEHQMDFSFLSKAYSVLRNDYKQNLQNLWIVHPTIWVKMAFFFCSPFLDPGMMTKVTVCEQVEDLFVDFDRDGLPLPKVVQIADEQRRASWF
eukprot:c7644_g1_i1.p1 GENE.c7644_g1_i1~~c7644_g1_i1.p1  ORF type:complete len:528 (+),score=139.79 c7644_g1_i1:38-1621(+)